MTTSSLVDVLGLGLVREEDAVAQDVGRDVLDVLGDHVAASGEEGAGARCAEEGERRAGRGAVRDEVREVGQAVGLRVARRRDELDEVALDPLVRVDPADEDAEVADRLRREDGAHGCRRDGLRRVAHAVEDLALLGLRRVADLELHEEAVDLRLGERIRSFLLDRVLRREDEERVRERGASCRRP